MSLFKGYFRSLDSSVPTSIVFSSCWALTCMYIGFVRKVSVKEGPFGIQFLKGLKNYLPPLQYA